jgi:hypothetical protein
MTSWQIVRLLAGMIILLSVTFGVPASPIFYSSQLLCFTAFVGAKLLQSAFPHLCQMKTVFRKPGVPAGC